MKKSSTTLSVASFPFARFLNEDLQIFVSQCYRIQSSLAVVLGRTLTNNFTLAAPLTVSSHQEWQAVSVMTSL